VSLGEERGEARAGDVGVGVAIEANLLRRRSLMHAIGRDPQRQIMLQG
jgi:hypothetical protein